MRRFCTSGTCLKVDIEIGQADAADLRRRVLVGHVLDIGEVHFGDEIDVLADRAVGPQTGAAHVRTVLQEKGQVLRLMIEGVVEIESAADVNGTPCRALRAGVSKDVQPRPGVGNRRRSGRGSGVGPASTLIGGRRAVGQPPMSCPPIQSVVNGSAAPAADLQKADQASRSQATVR